MVYHPYQVATVVLLFDVHLLLGWNLGPYAPLDPMAFGPGPSGPTLRARPFGPGPLGQALGARL